MVFPLLGTLTKVVEGVVAFTAVSSLYDSVFGKEEKITPKKTRTYKKKPDRTLLTQHQFDYIQWVRQEWLEANQIRKEQGIEKIPVQKLTDTLNKHLNLDKSTRSYSRVWSGEVDRDSLPLGKPILGENDDSAQ